jgi:hypothetical protein
VVGHLCLSTPPVLIVIIFLYYPFHLLFYSILYFVCLFCFPLHSDKNTLYFFLILQNVKFIKFCFLQFFIIVNSCHIHRHVTINYVIDVMLIRMAIMNIHGR